MVKISVSHVWGNNTKSPINNASEKILNKKYKNSIILSVKNFYKKFQLISKLPFWENYLRCVYGQAIQDAKQLDAGSINNRSNFTCLLCGVSGEITARKFINFVLKYNSKSKIIIIDIGQDQINSVKKLIKEEFPKSNIEVKQANALNLSFIKNNSIDWIDTDGFFSFFNENELILLFKEWKRILRKEGFITFRELTTNNFVSSLINKLRNKASRVYMGIKLNLHSTKELYDDFEILKFKFKRGNSPIPLLDRYCLINKN